MSDSESENLLKIEADDFMFAYKWSDFNGFITDIDPTVLAVDIVGSKLTTDVSEGTQDKVDTTYIAAKCGDRFGNHNQDTVNRLGL